VAWKGGESMGKTKRGKGKKPVLESRDFLKLVALLRKHVFERIISKDPK
jgi:hypothetical protein